MPDTVRNAAYAMRSRPTIKHGPWLDMEGVRQRLDQLTKVIPGGQAGWAKRHGISPAYVNDVLRGRRIPGDKITRAMGLEKALLWRTPNR